MTVADIVKALDLKVFSGNEGLNQEIAGGYTSDLLSDVMGNADAGMVWITLQTHINVMAIASLKELAAIILVRVWSLRLILCSKATMRVFQFLEPICRLLRLLVNFTCY